MNKAKNEATNVAANEAELIKGVSYDPEPETEEAKNLANEEIGDIEDIAEEIGSTFYDPYSVDVTLEGLALISKVVKDSTAVMTRDQARVIIDSYYQVQKIRIAFQNQTRAVIQGYDDENVESLAVTWILRYCENLENQIKKLISGYAESVPVCKWAMATKGIGPIFAVSLWCYIDMDICKHANQFLSYAGLNDNNTPWLGKDRAENIVNEAYLEFGLKKSDPVNDDVLTYVAQKSGRKFPNVLRGFESHKEKAAGNVSDRVTLIKYLSKPPYNRDLKTVCFLIGEAFCKVSNRGSKYGVLYRERKAWETMRNENLEYKEQADRLLSEKNYDKSTPTYKFLSEGKLSPAHINQRAKRHATKIFLTHFFEACWIDKYGTKPPVIYPIAFQDHVDYITPEVPFGDYI